MANDNTQRPGGAKIFVVGGDNKEWTCPQCRQNKGWTPFIGNAHDHICNACKSRFPDDFIRGWNEAQLEVKMIEKQLAAVSAEWQSANRMLWLAAFSSPNNQLSIPYDIMKLPMDQAHNFEIDKDDEKACVTITALTKE